MRHDFIDRYSRIQSPVHALPPYIKMFSSVTMIAAIIATPPAYGMVFITVAAILIVVSLLSRVPIKFLIVRLLVMEPYVLSISLLSLFKGDGGYTFLTIVVKSTLSLFVVIILSNTTQFSEILNLLKRLRVPSLFITILALMYRYLFVLIDEAERMRRARTSRSFIRDKARVWNSLILMIGQLFVRSSERAERIYASMRSRGWK